MTAALTPMWVVGFAGHRHLEQPAVVAAALDRVLSALTTQARAAGGRVELYGSAASGADVLFHEVAARQQLPVRVVLPLPPLEFQKDFSPDDWVRASSCLDRAASIHVATSNATRPDCYVDANYELLGGSDALVAVWDGEPARGAGGTAELVEQARGAGLPLVIVRPDGSVLEERLDAFTRDPGTALFERLTQLASAKGSPPATPAALREALDAVALQHSGRYRDSSSRLIIATTVATVLGASAAVIPRSSQLIWDFTFAALMLCEALIVLWVVLQRRRLTLDRVHEQWLDARFAAEVIRSLEATAGLLEPFVPLVGRADPVWRRLAVSVNLALLRAAPPTPWPVLRDAYVSTRLVAGPGAQVPYFERKAADAAPLAHRARRWSSFLGRLALGFALLSFAWKAVQITGRLWHDGADFLTDPVLNLGLRLLPVALPVLAASASALETARDGARRHARYPALAALLRARATQLPLLSSETSVRRTITRIEELLLIELIEWRLAEQRNRASARR